MTIPCRSSALFVVAFALIAGCGDASDPGSLHGGSVPSDNPPAADPTASTTSDDAGPGGSSGSSGSSGDAGTDAAPPPDFFTGAPAYANTAGRSTTNDSHPNGGTAVGAACFSCHGKNEFSMVMGGTVFADAAGTAPAANAQVVLKVGATFFSANTNANGNFLVMGSPFAGTANVGVRNGASSHLMSGSIATGDCNSCHDGTTTSRIHLP